MDASCAGAAACVCSPDIHFTRFQHSKEKQQRHSGGLDATASAGRGRCAGYCFTSHAVFDLMTMVMHSWQSRAVCCLSLVCTVLTSPRLLQRSQVPCICAPFITSCAGTGNSFYE